jgi:hypothetical protein
MNWLYGIGGFVLGFIAGGFVVLYVVMAINGPIN